jgi:alpha-1,3-rhamnosyltransferase
MPSYNHARYIAQAVESVWRQTFRDIELIVVDDGSTDRSLEILQQLEASSPLPMVVVHQENRGVTTTLNRALSISRGEYICLLASDDYYDPRYVETYVETFDRFTHPVALHCDAKTVDENGKVGMRVYALSPRGPARGMCFEEIATSSVRVIAGSFSVPRNFLLSIGAYDPNIQSEDFDVYLRTAREIPFIFIDQPLYFSRHLQGSLGRRPWVWAEGTVAALEKHRDFLGPRFAHICVKRYVGLSYSCFAHGGAWQGLCWAWRTLKQHQGSVGGKLFLCAKLARGMFAGLAGYQLRRILPPKLRRIIARQVRRFTRRTSHSQQGIH